MSPRILTWPGQGSDLGRAVVAIGVFDGVHLGHQALLAHAVAEARRNDARSVALTFDRDPDQIVTPETAAPQLLSLEAKCAFILATGIDTVLVVPFTHEVAATDAETFLDSVLGTCCRVVALHVGRDFRFGARAAGDVETLLAWAAEHDAEVRPHSLVERDAEPVTSTRIRALVANGQVEEAAGLLGKPTRVEGRVVVGRQQGSEIGFPTANVTPNAYAALPADGVYAGRALLADGTAHAAAISVGVPPSFPQARDYLEAHLIDFKGDLYDQRVTLEFLSRLRDQRSFGSLEELSAAIAADVDTARTIAEQQPGASVPVAESDLDYIDDPDALAAAEKRVAAIDPMDIYKQVDGDWVELMPAARLSGLWGNAGFNAAGIVAPLEAEGIPFVWDPYPPESMPNFRAALGVVDRPFRLLVPSSVRADAMRALGVSERDDSMPLPGVESFPPVSPPAPGPIISERRPWAALLAVAALVIALLIMFFRGDL